MKQTIANRSAELKSITPIHARQAESDKVTRDVELFLANGGSITSCDVGAFGFKSDLQKGNEARKKQGAKFACKNQYQVGK